MMKWFDELYSWQKAQDLALSVIEAFEDVKDVEFANITKNCGIAISNEIARWYEKQYDVDFKISLLEAKWRCGKLRSMLHLAKKLNYLKEDKFNDIYKITWEVLGLIGWMIKSIKEKASTKKDK